MFCPPEYVHIHDLLNTCKLAARVQLPMDKREEYVYLDNSQNSLDPVKSRVIQRKVIELQMLKKVMEQLSDYAYAFAPPSTIFKLSPKIVRLTKPVAHIMRSADPKATVELFYIDARTGKIDLHKTADRMTAWFGMSSEKRVDRTNFHETSLEMQSTVIEEFGAIDGYTVCFDRSVAELKITDIVSLFNSDSENRKKTLKGRPTIKTAVREVYLGLFPNGHGSMKQTAVVDMIRSTGQDCSTATLQRVLRDLRSV